MKLSIIKSTTCTFEINLTDENGDSYELGNNETIRVGVKRNLHDSDCLILKEITASTNGKYIIKFAPEDTNGLEPGRYYYDAGLQSGADYYNILPTDVILIESNVTKAVTE